MLGGPAIADLRRSRNDMPMQELAYHRDPSPGRAGRITHSAQRDRCGCPVVRLRIIVVEIRRGLRPPPPSSAPSLYLVSKTRQACVHNSLKRRCTLPPVRSRHDQNYSRTSRHDGENDRKNAAIALFPARHRHLNGLQDTSDG